MTTTTIASSIALPTLTTVLVMSTLVALAASGPAPPYNAKQMMLRKRMGTGYRIWEPSPQRLASKYFSNGGRNMVICNGLAPERNTYEYYEMCSELINVLHQMTRMRNLAKKQYY